MPSPRLMVVGDDPGTASQLQDLLGHAGYEDIITIREPSQAIAIIDQKVPDLVLLAVTSPGANGLDTLQGLRSSDRSSDLPVIMVTVPTDRELKAEALELGVTDFLHMPIDPIEFIPRIRNALSIKALWHQYSKPTESSVTGEAQTCRKRRPEALEKPAPSRLSWPVLRQTRFQELKSKAKLMIVDDEAVNNKVACKHLSSEGYTDFITTTESAEAVNLIYRERPDVVLLDIMMPNVNGLDILKYVREDEAFIDLPMIILTAVTDRETKQKALDLGATEFLTKPLDPMELLPRVRNAVLVKAHQDHVKDYVRELEGQVSRYVREVKEHALELDKAN